jgi:hypothetical protein
MIEQLILAAFLIAIMRGVFWAIKQRMLTRINGDAGLLTAKTSGRYEDRT